jgi:hypothetical protein
MSAIRQQIKTPPCPLCDKVTCMEVLSRELFNYLHGMPVEEAFPDFSSEQRELFTTGTHPECKQAMFEEENTE